MLGILEREADKVMIEVMILLVMLDASEIMTS